ncbi:hypothetical protein FBF27_03900 [Candidatus Saccharibacteria bacterium oral taxon 488]|nr:hypothetical protein FBF27_03900 [Candidatus Saccharibacteria bacterium oral taxon 488]
MERLGSIDHGKDFASSVEEIINQPLTVENVDTYAEAALDKLIQLINDMVQVYNHQPTIWLDNSAERENAVFAYYGIEPLNELLDHIAAKAEQLIAIDTAIDQIESTDHVFVPPDDRSGPDAGMSETPHRERATRQPRLKTLLFVLANEFGIEPSSEALRIRRGEVETMMRQEPYHEVNIPPLERTVLICDAYGNGTFVFDTTQLPEEERAKLATYTKTQLAGVMEQYPGCGVSVRCDQQFVLHLVAALANDIQQSTGVDTRRGGNYLNPPQASEEGMMNTNQLAAKFGVVYRTIVRHIAELNQEGLLGCVAKRDWYGEEQSIFTEEQVEVIRKRLEERGLFTQPPPEGYLTITALAKTVDVTVMALIRIARELKKAGVLSDGIQCRSGQVHEFYSPEQQAMIMRKAQENGLFAPPPPEGYVMISTATKRLGVSLKLVRDAIDSLNLQREIYRFVAESGQVRIREGLSPEQVDELGKYLRSEGYTKLAPEGYRVKKEIMRELHCSAPLFDRIVDSLIRNDPNFGQPSRYRAKGKGGGMSKALGYFYSPEQQAKLAETLKEIRQGATC